ncbi:MAG: hypothetical protein WCB92_04135 [Mycobacterium sp.]
MTTSDGSPSQRVTATPNAFGADAAVQAAAGEATVIGTNQDLSRTGAADAASGQAVLRGNIANAPGPQAFTDE